MSRTASSASTSRFVGAERSRKSSLPKCAHAHSRGMRQETTTDGRQKPGARTAWLCPDCGHDTFTQSALHTVEVRLYYGGKSLEVVEDEGTDYVDELIVEGCSACGRELTRGEWHWLCEPSRART